MKKLFLILALGTVPLAAQTVNPNQIRPSATPTNSVMRTVGSTTAWGSVAGGDGINITDIGGVLTFSQGPVFGFSSFTCTTSGTYELGTSIASPTNCTAAYTTPASAATLTDGTHNVVLSSPYTSGSLPYSYVCGTTTPTTLTFSQTATPASGGSPKTANATAGCSPRYFGGVGAAGATSSVTASGTTAVLSNGAVLASAGISNAQVGVTIGSYSPINQKVYVLLIGNSHTVWTDNLTGFAFVMGTPTAVSFTNQNGSVVSMYLYESINLLSGTYAPKPTN